MRRIILSGLYWRALQHQRSVSLFYPTIGVIGYGPDEKVLVCQRERKGDKLTDMMCICTIAYAAHVNPSDPGNHYWKITLAMHDEVVDV